MKRTQNIQKNKLFAFWKYDLFPYILGAPVIELMSNGRVKVEGYQGVTFNPIKLLPLLPGKELYIKIKYLESKYNADKIMHEFTWEQELKTFLDQVGFIQK